MQLNFKARDWHNWISAILSVPLLLVGLTSLFLAHKKELQLNDLDLSAWVAWLPGYGNTQAAPDYKEIRSSLQDSAGRWWIGTQAGLYRLEGERVERVREIGAEPVRDLVQAPWGLVAASKSGVWSEQDGRWVRNLKGDAWNANLQSDGSVGVTLKDRGLLLSRDGHNWTPAYAPGERIAALPSDERPGEKITLGKLMLDLHTGKALFGKAQEWIWIDLLGAVWAFLGFTGIYLWWRSQTKRRDAARNKLPKELAGG